MQENSFVKAVCKISTSKCRSDYTSSDSYVVHRLFLRTGGYLYVKGLVDLMTTFRCFTNVIQTTQFHRTNLPFVEQLVEIHKIIIKGVNPLGDVTWALTHIV